MRMILDIQASANEDRIPVRVCIDREDGETPIDGDLLFTPYELTSLIASLASDDNDPVFAIRASGEMLV